MRANGLEVQREESDWNMPERGRSRVRPRGISETDRNNELLELEAV